MNKNIYDKLTLVYTYKESNFLLKLEIENHPDLLNIIVFDNKDRLTINLEKFINYLAKLSKLGYHNVPSLKHPVKIKFGKETFLGYKNMEISVFYKDQCIDFSDQKVTTGHTHIFLNKVLTHKMKYKLLAKDIYIETKRLIEKKHVSRET